MWRIYRFPLNKIHPSVKSLQLHLENMQYITFKDRNKLTNVINDETTSNTTLTEYFKMNEIDPNEKNYLSKTSLKNMSGPNK